MGYRLVTEVKFVTNQTSYITEEKAAVIRAFTPTHYAGAHKAPMSG